MAQPQITSLQNERVKSAIKLRDRRGRDKQQRIVIDGTREIGRALEAGVPIDTLFLCEELCDDACERLARQAIDRQTEVLTVTRPVMEKLAFGDRAEGLLAVAHAPELTLDDLGRKLGIVAAPLANVRAAKEGLPAAIAQPLIAVVEGVEKPGNVGAILRTADAAGISALIVADGGTDLYNPNAIRASLGAIFTLPVCAAKSESILAWLRKHQFRVLATRVDGAVNYATADYTGRCAIVLGSEAHGLTRQWQGDSVTAVMLPMLGKVDSLNVSATAAVLFYEALRQRSAASCSPAVIGLE